LGAFVYALNSRHGIALLKGARLLAIRALESLLFSTASFLASPYVICHAFRAAIGKHVPYCEEYEEYHRPRYSETSRRHREEHNGKGTAVTY